MLVPNSWAQYALQIANKQGAIAKKRIKKLLDLKPIFMVGFEEELSDTVVVDVDVVAIVVSSKITKAII